MRPVRSVLYMPGSNARALEKARLLDVDAVILDLEDAVAPQQKDLARQQVADAVRAGGFGHRVVIVRINGLDTSWGGADLEAASAAAPDVILVPKVSAPDLLFTIGQRLATTGAASHMRVWAMMETPLAVLRAEAIAAAALDPVTRLGGLVLGTNDLAKETRARLVPGRAPMLSWLMSVLAAGRAYGLDVIDGVYNDLRDEAGFAAECAQGRDLGFDGKTLIHPGQISACHAAFSPDDRELVAARRIIDAFDRPENAGRGAIDLDGRMVERLHADMARRVVAIADAIQRRDKAA
jgi:citrate lyase subunit beta/citryl-CoA lyase